MIGIQDIGVYIPQHRNDNLAMANHYQVDAHFITNKIGIHTTARKSNEEFSSDLCVKAFQDLMSRHPALASQIDCISVCTQNGDYQLPHTSAIVHSKLDLSSECAAFDISLGCSGYVYALHIMKSFMNDNGMHCGLLFTSDPYSQIVDKDDKNTHLLFGDAATVTLLTHDPVYTLEKGVFASYGKGYQALIKRPEAPLYMNGREIYNFVLKQIPGLIEKCLNKNNLSQDQVDYYLFHQASKYVIEKLTEKLQYDQEKVPFAIEEFGNTVSSSIPILLKEYFLTKKANTLLLCGFGVGLSMAATVIRRIES